MMSYIIEPKLSAFDYRNSQTILYVISEMLHGFRRLDTGCSRRLVFERAQVHSQSSVSSQTLFLVVRVIRVISC